MEPGTPDRPRERSRHRGRGPHTARPHRLRRPWSAPSTTPSRHSSSTPSTWRRALSPLGGGSSPTGSGPSPNSSSSTSGTRRETALGTIPGARTISLPSLLQRPRRAGPGRPRPSSTALVGTASSIAVQPAAGPRLHRRVRPGRGLHGVGAASELARESCPPLGLSAMRRRRRDAPVRLDVREDVEWAAGHAPDADARADERARADRSEELDASRRIVCMCRSGRRSAAGHRMAAAERASTR